MVESEFQFINNIKAWIHSTLCPIQAASGGVMVWDIFLAHLGTRKISAIFLKYFFSNIFIGENDYHLITIAYLSVIADYGHSISQKYSTPCHTVHILSNQFLEHDNAFSVLTCLDKH